MGAPGDLMRLSLFASHAAVHLSLIDSIASMPAVISGFR